VEALLQPLVDRRRRPKLHASHARQLGGRLLSKLAEALGGAFQARPRHRVGVGQQAHRETDHDRLHASLQQRHPRAHPKKRTRHTGPEAGAACGDEDGRIAGDGHHERRDAQRLGVDGCDDDEGDEVVKDDGRQHERAQPVGKAGPHQREQAEREGRIGRHRDPPPTGGGAARVEEQVDGDRRRHAADRGKQRQREPSPLPQLPEVELPPRLKPEDEEEEGHQAAVDPLAQRQGHARTADLD
jgi:hypothetical protein